LQRVSR